MTTTQLELPWRTEVTDGWRVAPLGSLVSVMGGCTPSKDDPSLWNGDIPWVSPKDMKSDLIGDSIDHVSLHALVGALRLIPPPAVLTVVRGMILDHSVPVALTTAPITLNQDMKALLPRKGVSAGFLAWSLRGMRDGLLALVEEAGHGTKKLRTDLWRRFPIPLPAESVQAQIASFLDRKAAAIDALIAKKETLLALLGEQRQTIISQAVTRGLDPNVPLKDSGIEWLGTIPAHWKTVALKRTARLGARTFTDGDWIESPFITDSGVRLIQTGNVGIGTYREKGFRFVSEETFRALGCTQVDPGDLLICRLDGPVGRACLAPDLGCRMITSVDNAILKPSADHDARFLVYFMSSAPWINWIQAICRVGGGFRLRVSRTMLGDLHVAVPSKEEQARIADALDRHVQAALGLEEKILRHVELLREYRQALITAAVTGKLDLSKEAC